MGGGLNAPERHQRFLLEEDEARMTCAPVPNFLLGTGPGISTLEGSAEHKSHGP